jgi:dihydropteroate synthase
MGVLNVTPDSFSDGGTYYPDIAKCVIRARDMLRDGADIVDVGGEAAGPTAQPVGWREDMRRALPAIERIRAEEPNVTLSVNTRYPQVARAAVDAGVRFLNVTGACGYDRDMIAVAAGSDCELVLWDLPTGLGSGLDGRDLDADPVDEVRRFLADRVDECVRAGIPKSRIWIDPGFGHPRPTPQVLAMLRRLSEFATLGCRLAVGVSRKRHLGELTRDALGLDEVPAPRGRTEAGLAETAWAIANGAGLIRTHDVRATRVVADVVWRLSG